MNDALVKIMLKNLGVDPDKMKQQFEGGLVQLKHTVDHFDRQLIDVHRKLDAIMQKMDIVSSSLPTAQVTYDEQTGHAITPNTRNSISH